jgi:hypothetical protein
LRHIISYTERHICGHVCAHIDDFKCWRNGGDSD